MILISRENHGNLRTNPDYDQTGRLHFGLKIMFMKDFLITMEIMVGRWGGQVFKHSAAVTGSGHSLF